jgi:hypothetical protein
MRCIDLFAGAGGFSEGAADRRPFAHKLATVQDPSEVSMPVTHASNNRVQELHARIEYLERLFVDKADLSTLNEEDAAEYKRLYKQFYPDLEFLK